MWDFEIKQNRTVNKFQLLKLCICTDCGKKYFGLGKGKYCEKCRKEHKRKGKKRKDFPETGRWLQCGKATTPSPGDNCMQ